MLTQRQAAYETKASFNNISHKSPKVEIQSAGNIKADSKKLKTKGQQGESKYTKELNATLKPWETNQKHWEQTQETTNEIRWRRRLKEKDILKYTWADFLSDFHHPLSFQLLMNKEAVELWQFPKFEGSATWNTAVHAWAALLALEEMSWDH